MLEPVAAHPANAQHRAPARRGFSLIDVLVTISVIVLLVSLVLPSLSGVKELSRRVVCSSNIRQMGVGIALYADDFQDRLVPSIFSRVHAGREGNMPDRMMTLLARERDAGGPIARRRDLTASSERLVWDGLGLLFHDEYLPTPGVFYCPSHRGNHPLSRYAMTFAAVNDEIVGNYHYRGIGPNGVRLLSAIQPRDSALVADGMRTLADYNHKVGSNVVRVDLTVVWVPDEGGEIARLLERGETENDPARINDAWERLDGDPRDSRRPR